MYNILFVISLTLKIVRSCRKKWTTDGEREREREIQKNHEDKKKQTLRASEGSFCAYFNIRSSNRPSKFMLFRLSKGRLANQPLKPLILHRISEETEQQDFTSGTEVWDNNLLLSKSTFPRSLYMKKYNKTVKTIGEIKS